MHQYFPQTPDGYDVRCVWAPPGGGKAIVADRTGVRLGAIGLSGLSVAKSSYIFFEQPDAPTVDEGAARAGEIEMVAVAPGCQRAGVGTSLVHRAVAEIKAVGVGLAVIGTGGDPGHAPARALYEKLNFNAFRHVRYYRKL